MKVFVAIDPGAKGSLCALSETGLISFMDYTEEVHKMSEWLKTFVDDEKIEIVMITIEDVHSIFGVSAKSNFNFGKNVGILHGLIRGMGLPLDLVKPKIWQKAVGVTAKGKEIKKDVASIARRLYPDCDIYTPRKRLLDGRSDALCLAHYSRTKYK